MHLKEYLEKRMLLNQYSDEQLFDIYTKGGESFYIGFDPSADSLQLGNLFAVMAAVNLMKYGNKCYFLVGGATGMIGDPGGKDAERTFLAEETLRHNEKAIYNQLKTFLEGLKANYNINFDYEMVNNYDFYKDMSIIEFFRQVGKYITINNMITKETVKKRIEDPDKSISYTEFSYMLLQGYDFVKLYRDNGVKLQLSGGDQWGNAVTGIELIRKILEKESHVMTIPLVTDSQGRKFGKSAGNAIWIDSTKNSPFYVYQYMINLEDELVESFLKRLTLLDFDEIDEVVKKHNENPENRYGQKILAGTLIEMLFGKDARSQAEKISDILFGKGDTLNILSTLTDNDVSALFKETGGKALTQAGTKLLDLLVETEVCSSKGEGKKLIESGAIYLNEEKISDLNAEIQDSNFINGKIILLRKGKKVYKSLLKN